MESGEQASGALQPRSGEEPRAPGLGNVTPAVAALVVAAAGSATLLLVLGSGLTFFQDEWDVVLSRRGLTADAYLRAHNEHLILVPVVIYKGLLALFGMEPTTPFRIVSTLLLLTNAGLLFIFLRRRVGEWLALIGVVPILFIGAGWQDLLWPFQMSLVGSMAAGLGMLLALEWDDPLADVVACALLTLSIAFGSLGLAFAAAAIVDVALRRDRSRAYIPLVPLVLYAAWYLAYGTDGDGSVTFENVVSAPVYLVEGLASALASLLGLVGFRSGRTQHFWEVPLLVVVAVLLALYLRRRPAPSPRLWVVAAVGVAFWILAGFNEIPGREPAQSRYQYVGAILLLIVVAELLRGVRLRPPALALVGAIAVAATISNVTTLFDGRDFLREQSDLARAETATLEIARGTINPFFTLGPDIAGTTALSSVHAGPYFGAVAEFGSPADTLTELEQAPESVRQQADIVLAAALPVRSNPARGERPAAGPPPRLERGAAVEARAAGGCLTLPAGASRDGVGVTLPRGGALVETGEGEPATLRLRRFATGEFPLRAGEVAGGDAVALDIRRDVAREPWTLEVTANQTVRVCALTGR